MKEILEYDYPKQFILHEKSGTKIYRVIGEDEGSKDIDDYQYSIITTISEKNDDGVKYTQIQHEDERLGWVSLNISLQLFMFKQKSYKFIAEILDSYVINNKFN